MTDTDRIAQMESMIRADMEKVCDEALDRSFKPISGCGIEAKIAQMAREAHDAGAKAGGWARKWEHMAPSQRKEWEAVALAVARLVAEDCAGIVDSADTPDGWSNSHISDAIRARYSKE